MHAEADTADVNPCLVFLDNIIQTKIGVLDRQQLNQRLSNMFHVCGWLKDQGIKYLQIYHYFDCQNSTLTWLCWSETEQCVYRMYECVV